MLRLRPLAIFGCIVIALCLLGLWGATSQTGSLRRVTNTTDEGININPSLSGDGRRISFESTEDIAHAGGSDHFRAIRADITSDPAAFTQLSGTRAPAPGISQDGSRIAFAAKDDPLGTNPDGNSEIFLYDGATLRQITNTTPNDISRRILDGNFQPSLTDDGRFIAFSSNRNLTNQNADGNLEIFIFDATANTFTQLTNTAGTVGASDAKISGDGARVAYLRDNNASPAAQRDLILQDRTGGTTRLIASNVANLAFTYGRAISDDGLRIVYSADIATDSSQVFLFDGRTSNSTRQITALGVRTTEVPLHPTISGDGTRIAFATRRPIAGISNTDNSIEVYTFDIPTGQFARVTNAPSNADGFDGSSRVAEVVSSLNDDGSVVAFNFPRSLSGAVTSGLENNSEIYVTGTATRPTTGPLTVLNEASFGHEPSTTKAVAPDSNAVALGGALAFTTQQAPKDSNNTFPTTFGGTTVTVNGRRAQITFVSPTQVNFIVPGQTEVGTADVVVTNEEGFQSRGTVAVLRAAPGIFTKSGDGQGEGVVLNANMQGSGTFDPSDGQLRLIIFTTGVRHATQVTATAGGRALTVESFMASPDMPGMDEVRVLVPADLRGAGTVNLVVRADNRDSNPVTIIFAGNACRDIVINEVLADPPDGPTGDANRDGTRDSNDDEFVELVNTTANNINIGGYQLLTRSTSATNDTLRHTFAPGTIFPSGSAIVVFGGGGPNFNPTNAAFGGAQVFKASSGALSLTNSGGVITLREPSQAIVNIFSYGGSTGLNGDANQSLTRSPDAGTNSDCGNFTLHSTAPGSNGQPFSPGTRVNGSPFASGLGRLTSITISPPTSSVAVGQTTQFTAQARDQFDRPMTNVTITFASDNTTVATVDGVTMDATTGVATATVTGRSEGTAHITAQATDGTTTVTSNQATLTVKPLPASVTRVEVSPQSATINRGQTQQFTATAFNQNNQPIAGATFSWSSSDTNVATINSSGLATGVGPGSVTITATTPDATGAMVSGTATLNVQVPLVINEINADVAADNTSTPAIEGDANRDGVRDSDDDEFIELLNNSNAPVDISGVIIADATSNRFTIPANTTLAAGRALLIFGGGTPPVSDPAFGGALILAVPGSGTLSLNDSGDTVNVKLNFGGSDHLIASVTYGGTGNPAAPSDQSLTRSPDAEIGTTGGAFVAHSTATNAAGRTFSPGTRADGTPFGSPAITRIEVSPLSATIDVGATQAFTARAFSNVGGPEIEVQNVSFIWDSSDTTRATVAPTTGVSTVAKGVASGNNIIIRARAGAQQGNGTLTVNAPPTTTTFSVTGQVKDASNNPLSDVLITFDMNFQGTLSTKTTLTDANGNYSSGDLGCQNNVKVTPSKAGYTFTPSAIAFVNSSGCLTGSQTANFTGAPPPPGTLVISQLYVGGGNSGATYTNDFVEIFNRGTTTVDFSQTPYSVQFESTGASTWAKTDITSGTIAPGQYFLVKEFSGGAVGAALPTPDATGNINLTSTSGKVALVVGTTLLTGSCPGDDGTSPFTPANPTIADFVGYGGTASTSGHCYEGPGPAALPASTNSDYRKGGGCVDTDFNGDDFLTASVNPRNSSSPLNDCSAGIKPEITINDPASVSESAANATFTVTLSTASTLTVTVNYSTADGTATAGADYQSTSGTLTFAPGETTKSINVPIINDTMDEPTETFFVNLTNASNSVILDNQGQGTITDNDAAPTISINDTSVTEGNSGTTNATFNVTLSAASGFTITVNYATADDTATAGSDYQSTSGTLTFSPGQTTQTILVPVNGDTTFEQNETFTVNLTTPTNATILDNKGVGTITNDDAAPPVPAISINDVSVAEGNSGTKTVDFTVSLSMTPTETITVDYATANGTATAGSDYPSTSGTLTFNPGETSKPVSVTINGDTLVEPDETFFVNLTNQSANAVITDSQGQGTITNDDTANLVISQVYGGGGTTGAQYQNDFVEIYNRGAATINFAVTPYSIQYAGATSNFATTPTATSLTPLNSGTIAPGQYFLVQEGSTNTVSCGNVPCGVALPTPDATGTINLAATAGKVALVLGTTGVSATSCPGDDLSTTPTNPSGNNIVDFVGYGTTAACYEGTGPAPAPGNTTADFRKAGGCTDTDNNAADFFAHAPGPRNSDSPLNNCSVDVTSNLTINDVTVTEGNAGTVTATFTVSLSTPANGTDVTFDIATQNNTAVSGSDYVSKSLSNQIIPAGQQTFTFDVTVNGDTAFEPNETFFVNVTNVSGANVTDSQGIGTIQNDDLPSLSVNDVIQSEGDSGTSVFTFTVSLSAPATADVTFDIATADGTATVADNDYAARSLTSQTIPAGQQTYTFDVTVNGDTTIEPNETFLVNVTNISGATALDSQGQGTIQNDDSPPTLSINNVTANEGNTGTTTFSFTVQLSAPAKAGGVTFDIATQDDTAVAGSDYTARTLTAQTIPEGSLSYTFDVAVTGDTIFEPTETFFVNVTNVTGATVTDGQGLGTITNDDTQPALSITDVALTEGNSGTSLMTFTVTLSGASQSAVSVAYATADSSATVADSDYDAASGTLTFAPGDTSKPFTVTIHGDTKAEGDEMFLVNLSGASGATLAVNQALGTIFLDDPLSVASLNTNYSENFDSLAQSGVSSTTPAAWTRAESGTSANTTYTANNGSSTTGDTYSYGSTGSTDRALGGLRTGTLVPTIGSFYRNDTGSTINTLQIAYTGEEWRLGAASRTDRLDFQYSTNATSLTTGTWTDVDALDFTTPNTTTTGAKDGNAAANRTAITSTITGLSIAPGATFWIRWTDLDATGSDDGLAVDDFSLSAGINTPALSISDVTQAEGNSGPTTFQFTVSLTSPAGPGGVSFNVDTADGTTNPATAGSDYVAIAGGSGSIAQNATSTTVSVTVNGDTVVEPDETFFVNLTNVSGATTSDGQGLGTITNDDAAAATSANLSVTKTDSPDPVVIGNDITYTITVNNAGPDTATNAVLSDTVPTNTTFRSIAAPAGWTCPTQPAVGGTGAISCTNPSFGVGSSVFTLVVRVGSTVAAGTTISNTASVSSSVADPDTNNSVTQTTTTRLPLLVISQIYTTGGATGALYNTDYIEIFNRDTVSVNLSGFSVQYAATGTSTFTVIASLPNVTLAPRQYFLIQAGTSNATVGANLPVTPDQTGSSTNMTGSVGKVAIVAGTAALTSSNVSNPPLTVGNASPGCPTNASIVIDFVGYGTTASCYEGNGRAPDPTTTNNSQADFRNNGGCTDTNDNQADFTKANALPRNSSTIKASCP